MRARTLILFLVALVLAGGTGLLVRSWLMQRATVAEAAPVAPPPAPQKMVLVARGAISRGQILKPADLGWQAWPEAGIGRGYTQSGTKTIEDFAGWVAREPFAAGDPISEAKIVSPGSRGFLAAVLSPGMRAVSVPVTPTSGISGFVFPGDQVDIVVSETVPGSDGNGNTPPRKGAETVLRDLRVLAVDQKLDSKAGEAVVAQRVTLEVTPKQSEIIAVASEMGKLSLSLRSLVAAPDEDTADSRDGAGTLDSEVSQLLRKPLGAKGNQGAPTVSILRGNGKSDTTTESQPASRGL
jgi:pilus assembly protein CpaB